MSDLLAIFAAADEDRELLDGIAAYRPTRVTVLIEDHDAELVSEDSSAGAALIMQHAGINNVSALKGGLHAWENANYPIVRSSP